MYHLEKKQVEIYILVPDEQSIDEMEYKLVTKVSEHNKADLKLQMFPNVQLDFEQLFDGVD